ncbi:DUF371 domain-containing protein [Natronoarchaeum rubrum]|uniref:DUF371 domain-containing protein n=1 Tax=Natronoarchaeum rubrum TaxID=755311 RepID=UPI002111A163|nr:DUF371 domain-containing protein [Natronoarchaeum rubrum]HMB51050.1 DUF371 domain-containing protein [Natronoarchaeum rubrum]
MREVIRATGHPNVLAEHTSTFEVTTDDYLTPAGDCILAIEADRAPADFDAEFVEACQNRDATITAELAVGDRTERITGSGHPDLSFESERSAVGRTSDHVDERTVMIDADSPALGVDREIVEALADGADATLTLSVE